MRVSLQKLILLLLCCLLPLQGALAFARSVGMISHHATFLQTASVRHSEDLAPDVSSHHMSGHQQTDQAQPVSPVRHTDAAVPESSDNAKEFSALTAKQPRHSPASCIRCGECCLMGAVAPPPVVMQVAALSFVLRIFKSNRPETAGHIPEKPERPPRRLARSLT